jgi:hypothetical protein
MHHRDEYIKSTFKGC